MEKKKCMIVDDEPLAQEVLESLVEKVDILEVVKKSNDAVDALNYLQSHRVDLLFLDIQMPEMTGMEMLRTLSNRPSVIFTTAYREFALDSYELEAIDYLVKPIPFSRFMLAVDKFLRKEDGRTSRMEPKPKERDYIFVSRDKMMVKIYLEDILFVESQRDYVRFKTKTDDLLVHRNLSFVESKLPPDRFLRIHRSFIVSVEKVDAFTASTVRIGGQDLTIGRNYRQKVAEVLTINRDLL